MTTPDLLPTVAANVLRVLDGGDPDHIANALSDYAWAQVEVRHNVQKQNLFYIAYVGRYEQKDRDRAKALIAESHTIYNRLLDRSDVALRAELERVAQPMERAA